MQNTTQSEKLGVVRKNLKLKFRQNIINHSTLDEILLGGGEAPSRFGKTALIIGRFQPFHLGHLKLIEIAADNSEKLIIGIGSSQESNTKENPFTADERKEMIENSVNIRILCEIIPIPDINNDKIWVSHVKKLVPEFHVVYTNGELERRLFKDAGIDVVSTGIFNRNLYSGTEIRRRIASGKEWEHLVPEGTSAIIKKVGGVERVRGLYA